MAFHLVQVKRDFVSLLLIKDCVFNSDETHFEDENNYGRTLAIFGDEDVNFCDLMSGSNLMTFMLMLGCFPDKHITLSMVVLQTAERNYPIVVVSDTVSFFCYITKPKGWIDGKFFL